MGMYYYQTQSNEETQSIEEISWHSTTEILTMGTDIHGVFQAKINSEWKVVPTRYEFDRHYMLFAYLANVRNEYGFAGVPTHLPIDPISEARGFPSDWTYGDECPIPLEVCNEWERTDCKRWMGDHSYSWLTANEILSHNYGETIQTGVVPIEIYRTLKPGQAPESWCGSVIGPGIVTAQSPLDITDKTTHVSISWPTDSRPGYFLDEVQRLKDQYGEVRFVFGFDS